MIEMSAAKLEGVAKDSANLNEGMEKSQKEFRKKKNKIEEDMERGGRITKHRLHL